MQFGSLRAADAEATQCRKQQPKGQEFRWLHATEQDRQHTAGHSSADGDAGAAGDAGALYGSEVLPCVTGISWTIKAGLKGHRRWQWCSDVSSPPLGRAAKAKWTGHTSRKLDRWVLPCGNEHVSTHLPQINIKKTINVNGYNYRYYSKWNLLFTST